MRVGGCWPKGQIQFMHKSLQQSSPYKKRGELPLSSDQASRSGGQFTNYTEIMISTNNREVPFISIYRPDSSKQQHRLQAATILHKCIQQYEQASVRCSFGKIIQLKHYWKMVLSSCMFLCQAMQKLRKRNMASAFFKISANRMKNRAVCLAMRTLSRFQTNFKIYNSKCALHMLRQNRYQVIISELNDSNELVRKMTDFEQELTFARSTAFSEQFITKSRQFQRIIGHFVENLRKNDYQAIVKSEIKRFEDVRSKMIPKRRQLLENQSIAIIMGNIIKAYEAMLIEKDSRLQQLQKRINEYQSSDEITKLNEQLQGKIQALKEVDVFANEFSRMAGQIKRKIGRNTGFSIFQAMMNLQQKKLQPLKHSTNQIIKKIIDSCLFLVSLYGKVQQMMKIQQAEIRKKAITFMLAQGEQNLPLRFFQALQATLQMAQFPSQIVSQILQYKQIFLQLTHRNEQLQQKLSSQALVEEMAAISSQLKQENENLKAFEKNYYELVSKNLEKDTAISQIKLSYNDRLRDIQQLEQKLRYFTTKNLNSQDKLNLESSKVNNELGLKVSLSRFNQFSNKTTNSRHKLGDSSMRPVQLMKQILTLKMSLETQVMSHEKQVRELRNQIFGYQTVINQLQAELLQKNHQFSKQNEVNREFKEKMFGKTKRNHVSMKPDKDQSLKNELKQLRQQRQAIIQKINEEKSMNQCLKLQINHLKRQSYKKQKLLQNKLMQKNSLVSKLQEKISQFSIISPCFNFLQSPSIKQPQILARDQYIRLLTLKVKSLQALLSDITHQYHQLELQLHPVNASNPSPSITTLCEEKHAESKIAGFGEEIGFFDDKILSQRLKELMASNESLAYSIDYIKEDFREASEQYQQLPEKQGLHE